MKIRAANKIIGANASELRQFAIATHCSTFVPQFGSQALFAPIQ